MFFKRTLSSSQLPSCRTFLLPDTPNIPKYSHRTLQPLGILTSLQINRLSSLLWQLQRPTALYFKGHLASLDASDSPLAISLALYQFTKTAFESPKFHNLESIASYAPSESLLINLKNSSQAPRFNDNLSGMISPLNRPVLTIMNSGRMGISNPSDDLLASLLKEDFTPFSKSETGVQSLKAMPIDVPTEVEVVKPEKYLVKTLDVGVYGSNFIGHHSPDLSTFLKLVLAISWHRVFNINLFDGTNNQAAKDFISNFDNAHMLVHLPSLT